MLNGAAMKRVAIVTAAGAAAMLALTAAQQAGPLAQASPGLWEISGAEGAKSPIRQCISDLSVLAQFEHRGRNCSSRVISSSASSTVIEYRCGGAGFGRSKIDVITPRNLRVDTQGISNNLPFGYVLQARRVGDCPAKTSSASAH
jgi:hypothetical protein